MTQRFLEWGQSLTFGLTVAPVAVGKHPLSSLWWCCHGNVGVWPHCQGLVDINTVPLAVRNVQGKCPCSSENSRSFLLPVVLMNPVRFGVMVLRLMVVGSWVSVPTTTTRSSVRYPSWHVYFWGWAGELNSYRCGTDHWKLPRTVVQPFPAASRSRPW